MYKLILSDLDETLLVNHHVPDFNLEAIRKAQDKGIKFVPTTGRAYNMIGEILNEIGTYDKENEYSICFNGALIIENKNNRILHFERLSYELTKELFDQAHLYDVCVLIFTMDCCYIFNVDPNEVQRKIDQKAPFKVIDEFNMGFLKDEKIAKILYERRDMDYLVKIKNEVYPKYKDRASISFSSGRYLEFNALGVSKGNGLKWLTDYLGISINECVAIGDNYNDVEMIEIAGLGACVASADENIKKVSDVVMKHDYFEGAVKELIEEYVLED